MDRRSFLTSLPFIPAAFREAAIGLASLGESLPAFDTPSEMDDVNALFAEQTQRMQEQIMRHIAETNPYAKLFDAHSHK